jgi:nicotinate-nucleotide adenylyltransferase
MRLGIMGGTFDPIHIGHLILGEQAWEALDLDKVLFITAGQPPHKPEAVEAEAVHRYNMVRLSVQDNEHFECSRIELDRPGPSYTIDTVRQILGLYGEDTRVYLLVGADEAREFMTWRDPYGIKELSTIVVANRPGYPVSDVLTALPSDFASAVKPLEMPGVDISSTDIRARVKLGCSIKYLVPSVVESYIIDNGLYRGLK